MALTINDQPADNILYPAYNPLEYLVTSTNSTEPNFKVYAYIHRDPSGDNELVGIKRVPITPGTTKVILDISEYAREYVESSVTTPSATSSSHVDETEYYETFRVAFREYYGTPPVLTGSFASGNIISVYNCSVKFVERYDTTLVGSTSPNWRTAHFPESMAALNHNPFMTGFENQFTTFSSGEPNGLTTSSKWLKITPNQKITLGIKMRTSTPTTTDVKVMYYNAALTNTGDDLLSGSSLSGSKVLNLNIGLPQIYNNADIVTAPQATDKYMAVFIDESGYNRSCALLYELCWDVCDKYTSYNIHWVNRFGGWDSYTFTGRSYWSEETERVGYLKDHTPFSGTDITESVSRFINGTHYIGLKDRYKLNTQTVRAWMASGFKDLFSSQKVYWDHPTVGFIQIVPKGNMYEIKTGVGDKAFNVSLEFEIDHNNMRQRR